MVIFAFDLVRMKPFACLTPDFTDQLGVGQGIFDTSLVHLFFADEAKLIALNHDRVVTLLWKAGRDLHVKMGLGV